MTIALSRIFAPTMLLYSLVAIMQFAYGFYLGLTNRTARRSDLVSLSGPPLDCGLVAPHGQLQTRRRFRLRHRFLSLYRVAVMPYYLVKIRGAKGLLVILAFVGAYLGAAIAGLVLAITISAFRG